MILLVYNIIISFLLLIFFVNYFVNFLYFKDISNYKITQKIRKKNPLISILIPARNEEGNIKKCLVSLIGQDYKNIEVLVLNDNSTDNTAEIVKNIAKDYKFLKLIKGKPLKKGWTGKNFACYQLFKKSRGEYLFFTDADTVHEKNSVSSTIACLLKEKLDILSACPKQMMNSFHERMVIGLTNFQLLIPPLIFIKKSNIPVFGSGIGSLMLTRRESYMAIGGHKSIKGSCIEDTSISKLFIKMGYKFMIFNGVKIYSTSLYKNFRDIYDGFCRIFMGNFNNNKISVSSIILILFIFFLLPFVLLAAIFFINFDFDILFNVNLALLSFQVLIILLTRAMAVLKINGKIYDIFLHPISIFYMIFMDLALIFRKRSEPIISWKGRLYTHSLDFISKS
jgi:chlorobactene glucosyltransferase